MADELFLSLFLFMVIQDNERIEKGRDKTERAGRGEISQGDPALSYYIPLLLLSWSV